MLAIEGNDAGEKMGRTIAIGDIHGCIAALDALLREIKPANDDTLVFLGDYIDRGPDSAEVVRRVVGLHTMCEVVTLQGNHEAMLLMGIDDPSQLDFWLTYGGKETLASYGNSIEDIPEEHVTFFRECKLYHEIDDFFFVHANYTPTLPLEDQPEYAMLWEHLTAHLPAQHVSGKRAIVGHTPQSSGEVLVLEQLICIDTHCYGDGYLTALDVESQTIWQADKEGALREV